ncbi:lipopolysaccharide biosynthesis protein [Sphingosinicella soli]|uniref:O-antigen/teichoic acid export membrane protein n=1 Tax=Sphingosinicella soli TaxID=333708 RepID=A0A7W7B0H6_9SPHN|nr:hypothetical protein [Sphingosinicella soli]MBB4631771.1 O-antigen/teichoic acid export membrane protein [Sphingosinicella soli]
MAILSLVAIRYATKLLVPGEYGQLALLLAVQTFCGLFLINPVGQHINRNTHRWWDDGTLRPRLRGYHRYVLVVALVGSLATVVVAAQANGVLSALAMFVMVMAATWNATLVALLNMVGLRHQSIFWGLVTVVVGLGASVLLIALRAEAAVWFVGQAIGMALGALGAWWALDRRLPPRTEEEALRRLPLLDRATLLKYCLPLAAATGCMWLQLHGYRFAVEHYWGLAALGYVAVGLGLAAQLWALAEALASQFLLPFFYRRASRGGAEATHALSDLINTLGPVYLVLAAAMLAGAHALLSLLVDPQYAGVVPFVVVGTVVECARATANLLANATQITQRTRMLALPWAVGAAAVLIATATIGADGAPAERLWIPLGGAALLMLGSMWWRMRRELRFEVDALRWSAAVSLVLAAAVLALFWPLRVGSLGEALLTVGTVGAVALIAIAALLWSNPAMARLAQARINFKKSIK